jgi:hypothetical protein
MKSGGMKILTDSTLSITQPLLRLRNTSSLLGQLWVRGAGMEELERRLRVIVTEGWSWVEEIDGGGAGVERDGSILI